MRKLLYILFLIPLLCSSQVVINGRVVTARGKINIGASTPTDVTPPVIVLSGSNPLNITVGGTFTEPGYTATDNVDGVITGSVVVGGQTVDPNTVGVYVITYDVQDVAGNNATQVTRTVNVNAAVSTNLLLNGDFTNADEWTLRNGSTATGGTLTVVANGTIGGDTSNWSAEYFDIMPNQIYKVRRFRLTFDARQTVGSGALQIGERFGTIATQALTGSFASYQIEWNGSNSNGNATGHDLTFGGATSGDTFEIQNMVLEDIGISTVNAESGLPASVSFFTDFETGTYTYTDQWGANGSPPGESNQWEVDHGTPRTTDHASAAISVGRDGTGRAVWLGSYNGDGSRNELGRDNAVSWGEHWIGFSMYIDNPMLNSRIVFQERNLTDGGSNSVNPISIRENNNGTQLNISISQSVDFVDATNTYLAANTPLNPDTGSPVSSWYGAGTGSTTYTYNYSTGQWYDFVIHYKGAFGANYTGPDTSAMARQLGYDPRSDGYVELWINGVKIVDHVGTTTYARERDGAYCIGEITPKIGPYWSSGGDLPADIYYDNFKVWNGPGGTFNDVDPSQ